MIVPHRSRPSVVRTRQDGPRRGARCDQAPRRPIAQYGTGAGADEVAADKGRCVR